MKKEWKILLLFGIFVVLILSAFILKTRFTGLISYTDIENVSGFNTYAELSNNFTNVSLMEEFIFNWDATNYTFYNNSLVLMMNFNNLSSLGENNTHVFDVSLSQNNGTVSGATFTSSGKYNGGFSFDGISDYINLGNDSSLNITENITLSVWINSGSSTTSLGNVSSYVKINDTDLGGELDADGQFGASVANIGDLDGDGIIDLAVGAGKDDDGGIATGALWILFMNTNGSVKSYTKINYTSLNDELTIGSQLGISVANIGDLDGDGIIDLASGANLDNDGGVAAGALWIMFMNTNGSVKSYTKINTTNFGGELEADDKFGASVANIGDLDGDEILDLVVAATSDEDGNHNAGALWIMFMNTNGSVRSYAKINDTSLGGGKLDENDYFGTSVANIGDLNGDGIIDIAASANRDGDGEDKAGAVWILFMNTNGSVKSYAKINYTSLGGELGDNDKFGTSVANMGDLDGDGIQDIISGSLLDDDGGADVGALWIMFMNTNGSVRSYAKINDTSLGGELNTLDLFGFSVANIGDLNGDGVIDLASGAREGDGTGNVWIMSLEDGFGSVLNKQDSYEIRANPTHIKTEINGSSLISSIDSGWNHVALTSNTTHKSLYVNGVLSSITTSGTIVSTIYDTYIGKDFNGTIDEPRIWNKSLSSSEISQLYKSNLYKINSTAWSFYTNQSDLSIVDYNYYFFIKDSFGLTKSSVGTVEINTTSNFKTFLLLADTHYGNTEGTDGSSNDINYTNAWIKEKTLTFFFI